MAQWLIAAFHYWMFMPTFGCFWLRASSRSGFSMFGRRGHARRREAVAKNIRSELCASSPRHVLSRCYRCWDQDQISLVRALAPMTVNRRWNGSPDRHPKGTPLIDEF